VTVLCDYCDYGDVPVGIILKAFIALTSSLAGNETYQAYVAENIG
jgi:hypothetical protein